MLCDANGEYRKITIFDPKKITKTNINSVLPFTIGGNNVATVAKAAGIQKSGFIVGYESGHIRVYMKSDHISMPYRRAELDKDDLVLLNEYERSNDQIKRQLSIDVMFHRITNMALSPNEELLLFSTDHSQIISVKMNLEKPTDEIMPFDYLITSFHSKYVTGLDSCIKKQIIATCSFDRTVRLWGFESRSHNCSLKIV